MQSGSNLFCQPFQCNLQHIGKTVPDALFQHGIDSCQDLAQDPFTNAPLQTVPFFVAQARNGLFLECLMVLRFL